MSGAFCLNFEFCFLSENVTNFLTLGGLCLSVFVELNLGSLAREACSSTLNLSIPQHLQDLEKLLESLIDGPDYRTLDVY
jgi:hypothetical protein